jgi:predicted metalloprotease with PDZ domain
VDYADVAEAGWPAPRETAYGTDDRFVALGRSLFVTGAGAAPRVRFHLPEGWTVAVPWSRAGDGAYEPGSTEALVENLVSVGRDAPMRVEAGGFAVDVVAFGHWTPVAGDVEAALQATLRDFVRRMAHEAEGGYLVALLPAVERGGEAFRDSFALNWNEAPSAGNRADWANTIAHELFHAWNGTRMRGADYAATQWFQEGFTEYMANTTLHATGQVDDAGHHARIARHIDNYARLETPLDTPGTRKGPPLYSGGALVAYAWDAMIREATGGERSVDDVMRALWRRTGGGAEPYAWADIQAALAEVAPGDWAGFHARHIAGTEPLPIDATLRAMGLRRSAHPDGTTAVTASPGAPD